MKMIYYDDKLMREDCVDMDHTGEYFFIEIEI
jgi:hypothetical protein